MAFPMSFTPDTRAMLLAETIAKLEQLAAALNREPEAATSVGPMPPEQRLGKELLLGIRVLLPKLRSASHLHPAMPYRRCPSCEE
jgi:hypothetical protein